MVVKKAGTNNVVRMAKLRTRKGKKQGAGVMSGKAKKEMFQYSNESVHEDK